MKNNNNSNNNSNDNISISRCRKHKFDMLSSSQISTIIDKWLLDEKYRLICKLKFIDNWTYERIGEDERVDLTDRQVRNIVSKCSALIQKHIEDYVVDVELKDLIGHQS